MTSSDSSYPAVEVDPRRQWLLVWVVALAVTVGIVGGAEAFCRNRGQLPWVPDSKELWAFHRSRVYNGRQTVVLIGTSRMGTGISPEVFRERCPAHRLVQLSLTGSESPIGLLEHLAEDADFSGIALCDLLPPMLERARWEDQSEYYLFQPKLQDRLSTVIYSWLRNYLVVLDPDLSFKALLADSLLSAPFPKPDYRWRTFERFLKFDFKKALNLQALRNRRLEQMREEYQDFNIPSGADLAKIAGELHALAQPLRRRGGEIVFVRLPSSGSRLQLEEEQHPKAEYWDRFSRAVDLPCVHFQELKSSHGFECPDESHLDYRDAARFTDALIDELIRRRVLDAPAQQLRSD